MISVMNNSGFELDRTTDSIGDESQARAMVSGDGCSVSSGNVVSAEGGRGFSAKSVGSEEIPHSGVIGSSCKATYDGSADGRSMNSMRSEESRDSAKLDNRALETGVDGAAPVGVANVVENAGSERIIDPEYGWKGVGEEVKPGAYDIRTEGGKASEHNFDVGNGGLRVGKGQVEAGKSSVSQYDTMISQFDEFAANGKGKSGMSSSVGYGYEIGDMVWGKVKSHPWWPGHIFNEAFATSSVRRTKRAGHVLVAFFGDSSYGWFDPAELIPFDENFYEKSRQTNSRNFVKAVEEAIDEASRRRALGLACRCRNRDNFRRKNVPDYFAVDVFDYEPGGVYSETQIRNARDSFQPISTLAFVKQLALMPRGDRHGNIDFIKNKASVMAYRRAIFEEFDETYAQAFGVQPVRPSRGPMEATTQPARAPLSGPLVIAEALGKKKNSTKQNKAKDHTNKDRYLFKRRDEPSELKPQQIGQAASSMQPAYVEGSLELGAGDYVLQKRSPAVTTKKQMLSKSEQIDTIKMDGVSVPRQEAVTMQDNSAVVRFGMVVPSPNGSKIEPPSFAVSQTSAFTDPSKSSLDEGKGVPLEVREHSGYGTVADQENSGLPAKGALHGGTDEMFLSSEQGGEATFTLKHDRQGTTWSQLNEGFQPTSNLPAMMEAHGHEHSSSIGSGGPGQVLRMQTDTQVKKAKLLKRPGGELGRSKSVAGEKKKKKKKEVGEGAYDLTQKQLAIGKGGSVGRVIGKQVQVVPPSREDFQKEHHKRDEGASSTLTGQNVGIGNTELKLPQLLGDLQALALNPFHGVERNCPAIIRQAFLKFRALVYQKSLALPNPAEMESNEAHTFRSSTDSFAVSNNVPRQHIKPARTIVRPDDPTKAGKKRLPSDRQEELAAKRIKKINDIKSLAAEKRALQRSTETQRDGKETVAPKPLKPRSDSLKKTEAPAKKREPTMLVMKFPPKTTLPSAAELKARLARFGPLDLPSTRIFWKTSTCRVVFIFKVDAEAALKHLTGNNTLFGSVNVRCHIRPLVTATPEPESKVQREDAPDTLIEQRPPAVAPAQQAVVQLKSCLKKPVTDEGSNGGGGRGTPRVKFMLGGGESSGGGNKNNFINNASFADAGASSSSSHGMEFNSKNFQKVISPSPSASPSTPLLPVPFPPPQPSSQFSNASALNNLHYGQIVPPRNPDNFNPSTSPMNIDVGQQMLSLLTKCNEVVTNVRNVLGYVPYHPL
ncbi:hypothetical protein NMG60_11032199 [Bertholletia excelsa]